MCLERSATERGGERAASGGGNHECGNRGNDGAAREGLPRRRAPEARHLRFRRSALYVCLVPGMRERIRLPPRDVARGSKRVVHGRASGRRLRSGAGAGPRSEDAAREKPSVPLFRSHGVQLQPRRAAAAVRRRAPAGATDQVRVALPRIDIRRLWCWFRRRRALRARGRVLRDDLLREERALLGWGVARRRARLPAVRARRGLDVLQPQRGVVAGERAGRDGARFTEHQCSESSRADVRSFAE